MNTENKTSQTTKPAIAVEPVLADDVKLTQKQNAVINLLQNGWVLVTNFEMKGAIVCNTKYEFHINNGLFWRLFNMGLIEQKCGKHDDGGYDLSVKGKKIKTKAVSFDGK